MVSVRCCQKKENTSFQYADRAGQDQNLRKYSASVDPHLRHVAAESNPILGQPGRSVMQLVYEFKLGISIVGPDKVLEADSRGLLPPLLGQPRDHNLPFPLSQLEGVNAGRLEARI